MARGTLIILLIMSAATWYVGIVKLLEQRRLLKQGRELLASHGAELQKRASELADEGMFMFSAVAVAGIEAAAEHKGELAGRVDLNTWVSMAISDAVDSASHHMQNGLSVVATVGSTAPFVGLFGTVWGIYHALTAIGMSGQASIDKVAGPVGRSADHDGDRPGRAWRCRRYWVTTGWCVATSWCWTWCEWWRAACTPAC
ncbi:MotA/TolQ/ExbB proton channel family protein [Chromobacterium haemolyticum]|nr:MotA/TolQ/ExbB proton channel family protein [Chromobacterium haemolyticum]